MLKTSKTKSSGETGAIPSSVVPLKTSKTKSEGKKRAIHVLYQVKNKQN